MKRVRVLFGGETILHPSLNFQNQISIK